MELNPETRAGIAGAAAKHGSASDKLSFAASTAEATGKDVRSVQRDAERGEEKGGQLVHSFADATAVATGRDAERGEKVILG